MADKVLIVDDDINICRLLEKVMRSNELDSDTANSGQEALDKITLNRYDLILMDVTLGDMEGFDVIRKIRADHISTPIVIISGRNEDYDSVYGLSIGADDYITKPFRPMILGAKVKALIRRNRQAISENSTVSSNTLSVGQFSYDTSSMRFYKGQEELFLSSKESALLLLFLKNPQQVFNKDAIYDHVWGNSIAVDDNAIMVYINRLRSKIEEDSKKPTHILTVRGLGYRFVP
ncbi:response regulator transcription factor [Oribacterium sp. WCC10]|uniref:response regulator transcription factor n=1 Tax=Oribacterium sp. WCC10 TaxID=1855343 RepID=UPI0008ED1925|nr:response regulator transcription factor [Oribacterium sp. WCC10]SFG79916.1 DNA-binding response regulator, OmpR family, contains REC and winged-helix (wHTH) domain [Oribacterium sp. WCC10]